MWLKIWNMEAYKNFNHPELFLSLKRDLAMVSDWIYYSTFIFLHFLTRYSKGEIPLVFVCVFFFNFQVTQQVFVAEEWVKMPMARLGLPWMLEPKWRLS